MNKDCIYCANQHTFNCPNSKFCYDLKDKPGFELKNKYKSKLICENKVYYNIHHFNKLQKLLAKIIFKIKIEDIKE